MSAEVEQPENDVRERAGLAGDVQQPSLWHATLAVFRKDLRSELRSRYAVNALLLFATNSVVVQSLVLGLLLPSRNADLSLIYAALLWITVLFAAFTGLARAFVQEEEARTAAALRLAAPPLAVYGGKLLFNLLLLLLLDVVVTVLFVVLLRVQIGNLGLFLALLLAGSVGLVAATTLVAAMIARAGAKGALFAVLSFPLLVPLLVVAVQSTARALDGVGWDEGLRPLVTLLSFATVQFVASLFLFPTVWEA
ncbi:MAG TPA: heme exporter protein CcmB [Roseiflexaceae bacterium]|nr:heme exporter protein CcmB [Roseiflexaceae bacterium]